MIATDIRLTDEQQAALDYCADSPHNVVTLGGFGGTGKSTLVAQLIKRLPSFAVCAYTGKAANVLRRKGIAGASTIHSLIYKPVDLGDGDVHFELRGEEEMTCCGFIVDEASMVSREVDRDLQSFGMPIIYVGDHGQLEPISAAGTEPFNLMSSPHVTLETIHRNAGPIAWFAEHLRRGGSAMGWRQPDGTEDVVDVLRAQDMHKVDIAGADQIVCAYNKTRCEINAAVRECLGLPTGTPSVGDRVICLQNDRELGLFNGMQGRITAIDPKRRLLSFADEDDRPHTSIRYSPEAFGAERTPKRASGIIPFDWAYCVTCHKMQGSEADDVLVLEQTCAAWDMRRWCYTAASRAKRRLTWIVP